MSEYQYYEFQTIRNPLTDEAMREVSGLSSRSEVSRTSAQFNYSYGDFPADPYEVLKKHFDAFLYMANWGSRRLGFRFPASAMDIEALRVFETDETINVEKVGAHVLVDLTFENEGDSDWIEGEGTLDRLIGLYDELLAGDYRTLFLLWLQAAFPDMPVPPIPPGLKALSEEHRTLIDFFGVDADMAAAAALFSAPILEVTSDDLVRAFDAMPGAEHTSILRRMITEESPAVVVAELRRRLRDEALSGKTPPVAPAAAPALAEVLFEKAEQIRAGRESEKRKKEEAERSRKFAELDRNQTGLWRRVDELLAAKKTQAYTEAIGILKDLRDLALHQQKQEAFARRVQEIKTRYSRLSGLLWRIDEAKLF